MLVPIWALLLPFIDILSRADVLASGKFLSNTGSKFKGGTSPFGEEGGEREFLRIDGLGVDSANGLLTIPLVGVCGPSRMAGLESDEVSTFKPIIDRFFSLMVGSGPSLSW